jgi:transcriptional antiterminator RfaH
MSCLSSSKWFAVYTRSHAEKKIADEFSHTGIQHYLPMYKTIRKWSDRVKKVEMPLISSYIFVKVRYEQFRYVTNTPGVIKIVNFSGVPAPIPEWQLDNLKIMLGSGMGGSISESSFIRGEDVIIKAGPLKGLRGIISNIKGRHKIILTIEPLNFCFTVDINPYFVLRQNRCSSF